MKETSFIETCQIKHDRWRSCFISEILIKSWARIVRTSGRKTYIYRESWKGHKSFAKVASAPNYYRSPGSPNSRGRASRNVTERFVRSVTWLLLIYYKPAGFRERPHRQSPPAVKSFPRGSIRCQLESARNRCLKYTVTLLRDNVPRKVRWHGGVADIGGDDAFRGKAGSISKYALVGIRADANQITTCWCKKKNPHKFFFIIKLEKFPSNSLHQ